MSDHESPMAAIGPSSSRQDEANLPDGQSAVQLTLVSQGYSSSENIPTLPATPVSSIPSVPPPVSAREERKTPRYTPDTPKGEADRRVTQPFTFVATPEVYSRVLPGHGGPVTAVAMSIDGRRFATGSSDSTVRVWDIVTGRLVHTLGNHQGPVHTIAFAPNGIMYAADSQSIRIWEPTTGKFMRQMNTAVTGFAFNMDGKIMVTCAQNETHLFHAFSGDKITTIINDAPVTCVRFSPIQPFILALGLSDGKVRVFEVSTAGPVKRLHTFTHAEHSNAPQNLLPVTSISFNGNCKTICSSGADGRVRLFDLTTGLAVHDLCLPPRRTMPPIEDIRGAARAEEARFLANSGHHSLPVDSLLVDTTYLGPTPAVSFSPVSPDLVGVDAHLLLSAHESGDIRVWDADTGAYIRTLKGHSGAVRSVTFNATGRVIISGGDDGTVRLWDCSASPLLCERDTDVGSITAVTVVPTVSIDDEEDKGDSHCIAVSSRDGQVRTLSADALVLDRDLASVRGNVPAKPSHVGCGLGGNGEPIVAVASTDGTLSLLTVTHRTLASFPLKQEITALSFAPAPHNHLLAVCCADLSVIVYDCQTLKELRRFVGRASANAMRLTSVGFCTRAILLAVAGDDGTVAIYLLATGQVTRLLFGHTETVTCAAFASHGRFVAAGAKDGSLRVWNLSNGEVMHSVGAHSGSVRSLSFSPDERSCVLASGGSDGVVALWAPESGEMLYRLSHHAAPVCALTFLPRIENSSSLPFLVTVADDGKVALWDTEVVNRQPPLSYMRSLLIGSGSCSFTPKLLQVALSTDRDPTSALEQQILGHFTATQRHAMRLLRLYPGIVNDRQPQDTQLLSRGFLIMAKRRQSRRVVDAEAVAVAAAAEKEQKVVAKGNWSDDDTAGRTLLHWACNQRRGSLVRLLLSSSALRTFVADHGGYTALEIAVRRNDVECLTLLLDHLPYTFLHTRQCLSAFLPTLARMHPQLLERAFVKLGLEEAPPANARGVLLADLGDGSLSVGGEGHILPELWWEVLHTNGYAHSGGGDTHTHDEQTEPTATRKHAPMHIASPRNANEAVVQLGTPRRRDLDVTANLQELERDSRMVPVAPRVVGIPGLAQYYDNPLEDPIRILYTRGLVDVLGSPPVRAVLDFKWQRFARNMFFGQFIGYLVFLTLFCLATIKWDCNSADYSDEPAGPVRACVDLVIALMSVYNFLWTTRRIFVERVTFFFELWNVIDLIVFPLVILNIPARVQCWEHEDALEAVISVLLWVKLLSFARGSHRIGPFVRMLRLILQSIARFIIVLGIFIIAFSHALFLLFKHTDTDFANWNVLMRVFKMLLGGYEPSDLQQGSVYSLTVILAVGFCVIATIVALSLLVALMNSTYQQVEQNVENQWLMERTRVILELEPFALGFVKRNSLNFPTWLHVLTTTRSRSLAGPAPSEQAEITIAVNDLKSKLSALDTSLDERLSAQLQSTQKMVATLHSVLLARESNRPVY